MKKMWVREEIKNYWWGFRSTERVLGYCPPKCRTIQVMNLVPIQILFIYRDVKDHCASLLLHLCSQFNY